MRHARVPRRMTQLNCDLKSTQKFTISFCSLSQVLLRIYGRTHGEQALETVLTDTVVFTLLSERKLGPKLHGIFPGGRIEQYIPVSFIFFCV